MSSIIIVDNSPVCFCLQPENAIPIRSWFDDLSDRELPALAVFLTELNKFKDVRTVLSKVAQDDTASKPATSSIALLEHIMDRTKQSILRELKKNQTNTNVSTISNTSLTTANTSTHDLQKENRSRTELHHIRSSSQNHTNTNTNYQNYTAKIDPKKE